MYVHIGAEVMIDSDDIIAVIPRTETVSVRSLRRTIDDAIGKGRIHAVQGAVQKSYIICERDSQLCVYASPLSTTTLMERANGGYIEF